MQKGRLKNILMIKIKTPAMNTAKLLSLSLLMLCGSAFAADWLSPRFVEAFTATRESQYNEFRRKIPDVELERFFDLG